MTDEHERDSKESRVSGEGGAFDRMMEAMMGRCGQMMPHTTAMCCGPQNDEEETVTDATDRR